MYKDDYKFPDYFSSAQFWMCDIHNAYDTIISSEAVKKFNNGLRFKIPSLFSLDSEETVLSNKTILKLIESYKVPVNDMYDSNGSLLTKKFYKEILYNTNLDGIKDFNPVRYGISVRKTSIRSFPTESAVFSSVEHSRLNNFDRFQETGCLMGEPLLVFHESRDKNWYFVKMYNYYGWAKVSDIALSLDKDAVFDYADSEDFLMVTGKEALITIHEKDVPFETISCGMGTKLCLHKDAADSKECFKVCFPVRESSGILSFKDAYISKDQDISEGFLDYTRYNIINQAMKLLDTPYDWGDKFNGKDCSSFVMTIYKCFGFLLPRNADEQELSFINPDSSMSFNKEDSLEDRCLKMDDLKPGAALFLKGHVMMYLGKHIGTHYMIHSFSGYGVKKDTSFEYCPVLCVAISPVSLPTADGTPFIKKFTSAVHFQ